MPLAAEQRVAAEVAGVEHETDAPLDGVPDRLVAGQFQKLLELCTDEVATSVRNTNTHVVQVVIGQHGFLIDLIVLLVC